MAASKVAHEFEDYVSDEEGADTAITADPAWAVSVVQREFHGADQGTAVHLMMEHAELDSDPAELAKLTDRPKKEHAELIAMTALLLGNDVVRKAFASEHYRELPVLGRVGDLTIDGVVDLLYRDEDGWVVADYKTDKAASPKKVNSYFRQLRFYASILEKNLDAPIVRLELLFPRETTVTVLRQDLT